MSRKNKNKQLDLDDVAEVTREVGEKVGKKSKAFWGDFKKFAIKGNIIDLAVAVVIGTSFNKIVSSLVSCIITPLTSLILPDGVLADLKWVLIPGVEADEAAGVEAVSEVAVTYGQFLQNAIDFIVIALSIYIVLKTFIKVKEAFNRKEREAAEQRRLAAEEKKKAETEAEAERQARARREFLEDVSVQADVLGEIRDIMLRIEKKSEPPVL